MKRPEEWEREYAPPRTRLGNLQRGLGAGYLAALENSEGCEKDILACVINDPRLDSQVDDRDGYYATLLLKLDLDLNPLHEKLKIIQTDPEIEKYEAYYYAGILSELAERDNQKAIDILNSIVRSDLWLECLESIYDIGGQELLKDVINQKTLQWIVENIDDETLVDLINDIEVPLEDWTAIYPRLRKKVARAKSFEYIPPNENQDGIVALHVATEQSPEQVAEMTVEELLDATLSYLDIEITVESLDKRRDTKTTKELIQYTASESFWQKRAAFVLLGKRGNLDFIEEAEGFLQGYNPHETQQSQEEARKRICYSYYLENLPPEISLPLARKWFHQSFGISIVARNILAKHATVDDRELIEAEAVKAFEEGDIYLLCDMIRAMTAMGSPESFLGFLITVHFELPYSFGRRVVLKALLPHYPKETVRPLIDDALWDCEPENRMIACSGVKSRSEKILSRLVEIANDKFEDEDVRKAAEDALNNLR